MQATQERITTDTKVLVSSSVLRQALSRLLPYVKSQPIVPILENVLIKVSDNVMSIVASDLSQWAEIILPVESSRNCGACVPIRPLLKLLATITEQPITLMIPSFEEESTFRIICDYPEGEYSLCAENPVDLPKSPSFDNGPEFTLPITQLKTILRTVSGYMGKDDLRPAMSGINWHNNSGFNHEIAATDGHRLLVLKPDIKRQEDAKAFNVIIPRDFVNSLKSILPKKGDDVRIVVGTNERLFTESHTTPLGDPVAAGAFTSTHRRHVPTHVCASWGNVRITTRIIDERYPAYPGAIPVENPVVWHINRMDMIAAVRRANVFANEVTHVVRFELKSGKSTIHAENMDYLTTSKEHLPIMDIEGELIIGTNGKFLLEVLSAMDSPGIEVKMSQANRAIIFHPYAGKVADESVMCLLMPVALNTYA